MRAAGVALACAVIGGGIALGYVAAGLEGMPSISVLDFVERRLASNETAPYPESNRDNKHDRMIRLRTDRADVDTESRTLQRGDSLRQSYAATDPTLPLPKLDAEPPPMPKPRPKAQLLRQQQASYTLLSDLQIDAIRTRLKLTAAQQQNWPAVEEALRALATRLHAMKRSGEAPTEMAPDAAELARLRAAAAPLLAQLSAEQKRELRMLAHLIGLGKVVAQL